MNESYTFAGKNRRGASVVGRTTDDPAEFTRAKFKARWLSLHVWANPDVAAELVGSITYDWDRNRRVWWAEDRTAQ